MKTFQIRQNIIKHKSHFLSYMVLICKEFVLLKVGDIIQQSQTRGKKIESENAVELAAYVQRFNFVKSAAHCAAHLTAARQRFENAVIFSGSA